MQLELRQNGQHDALPRFRFKLMRGRKEANKDIWTKSTAQYHRR